MLKKTINKKIFILLLALLQVMGLKAQFPNYQCKTSTITAAGCFFNATDSESNLYIPNSSMPTLYYRVNFTFLLHPTIPTAFSYISQSQIVSDLTQYVALMNKKFDTCGQIPSFLTPTNPSTLFPIANPKIQLVLNNVYFHTTPLAVQTITTNAAMNAELDTILATFPHGLDSCVNFYSFSNTYSLLTQYQMAGNGFIWQVLHPNDIYPAGGFTLNAGGSNTLWHEFGHAIGNLGDHYVNSTFTATPNNQNPELGLGYIPDDAAVDVAGSWNCYAPFHPTTNQKTNNMMGGTGCREHLSPKQIAAFHYLVAKNVYKKFTQYKNTAYPYNPTSFSNTLTGTQTLTSVPPFNTIIVKSGANILIKNTTIFTYQNAKIIIEPGAKLTLNCVKILPLGGGSSSNLWQGIEVLGNTFLPQDIQSNGMSNNQGMLVADKCEFSFAKKAICVGNYNNTNASGGGIVQITNTNFSKNEISIEMKPKSLISIAGGNVSNLSYFDFCDFISDNNFVLYAPTIRSTFVKLNGVKDIKFYRCAFNNNQTSALPDSTFCIKGINSSVVVGKGNNTVGCTFWNTDYGIFLTNGLDRSIIQDNQFYTKNGIYISNSNYNKIVRNSINLNNSSAAYTGPLKTGIYLDNCNYYKVENNTFWTSGGKTLTEGICVNNSGPIANKIYNNIFSYLEQGIWCQNQNYNPITNDGLVINCNDFTGCDYNIGVQTPFSPPNNFGGIAKDQGAAAAQPTLNVRNTYNSVPSCTNENKFYSFTPYSNPPQVQHGNFLGAQFRVGPQPTCSDVTDVNDIPGLNPPGPKSGYCPDNSNLPAGKHVLSSQISALNNQITAFESVLTYTVDNGNTDGLLYNIATQSDEDVYNELKELTYLSDTVIKAYFTDIGRNPDYLLDIFRSNSPVASDVWEYILSLELDGGIMSELATLQQEAILSPRALVEAQLALAKNERSYTIMNKIMWFLNSDSVNLPGATINAKDSVAALIQLNNQGNVVKQLIELDLNFADYTAALSKANTYTANAQQLLYSGFINVYAEIMEDSLQVYALNTSTANRAYMEDVADDLDHPCQVWARNILNAVYNRPIDVLKLQPETGGGSRVANSNSSLKNKPQINELAVLMYPNPAMNELMFENPTGQNIIVKIYNVNGQLLLKEALNIDQSKKISTSSLINGIYFVHLSSQSGMNKINKLVIVK